MRINKFLLALLSILFYEILINGMKLDGVSLSKIVVTLFLWISFFISLECFITNYRNISKQIPKFLFPIFICLILWNVINIIRSSFDGGNSITTIFGNPYNSLAMLTPFALAFSVNKDNLRIINKFFLYVISIGIPFALIAMFLSDGERGDKFVAVAFVFIYPVTFLISTLGYYNRTAKFSVYSASLILFGYVGFVLGNRTTLIRVLLLYLSNIVVKFYSKYRFRLLLSLAIFTLLIPFYLIKVSDNSQNVFQSSIEMLQTKLGVGASVSALSKSDTRTFLYVEVFEDLQETGNILLGKGASGTYFSPYFRQTGDDTDQRLTVEVGVLALFLKGGLLAVSLNLILLYSAIYYAFFKTNNQYVMSIGFLLLIHTLILFIENTISYSIYNFSIWFFIGICLSKNIRIMSNKEIHDLLNMAKFK